MGKGNKGQLPGGVYKLPFDETGTEEVTPTDPFGDIEAWRNEKPDTKLLDASTAAEYDQATEDFDRQANSVYNSGLPLSYRLGRSARFMREMGQSRGLAEAAGQEGVNRVRQAQKAGIANLTRGVNTKSTRTGFNSGMPGQTGNGNLAAGIGAAGGITAAIIAAA